MSDPQRNTENIYRNVLKEKKCDKDPVMERKGTAQTDLYSVHTILYVYKLVVVFYAVLRKGTSSITKSINGAMISW